MLQPGESIAAREGEVVVCVPVHESDALSLECLGRLLEHTPVDAFILVVDDSGSATGDPELESVLTTTAARPRLAWLRQPVNRGFVRSANDAFGAAARADVVLVNSDCLVSAGWLEGLAGAAYSRPDAATATAITNNGTIVSVPRRNRPTRELPNEMSVDDAALAVRRASARLHPLIPTAVGHCMYIRRSALDAVGLFDEDFSPGYGEEDDFSQRCIRSGLVHVLADEVFVYHRGAASFGDSHDVKALMDDHQRLLASRHPGFPRAVVTAKWSRSSPLARALARASESLTGERSQARWFLPGPVERPVIELMWTVRRLRRGNVT